MEPKRLFVLLVAFLSLHVGLSQDRFKTTAGIVSFDASSPLEDIRAVNKKVNAILDMTSGKMAAVLLIKEFEFRRKLMQEHFNENYMHSDKYPKAVFTGSLHDYKLDVLSSEERVFELSGEITIHGVTRPLTTTVSIQRNSSDIRCALKFVVQTEEHNIKVPRVLFKKVAREVNVNAEFLLQPQ